ncbi:NUDIX hydrolase [Pseudomonas sp. NBRC 111119]|uniref:NUDIX hydrolase n=1 Tax=Pseudomonas sp. NBRC 111119 TaxID=1661034 RepID=UPI000761881D|nr:NUDIX hydrolase [Pseudomonas sp. NBRC 111119]
MNYCSACGQPVIQQVPEGDSRLRYVCPSCHTVHYQNPNVVAGVLATWGSQVLLCRRAIEPRRGFWTLPAGFMENGETLDQAARRETVEEACARVKDMALYQLFDLPHINQVHVFFRAQLADLDVAIGAESLEVRLFEEHEIPWQALAFRTVARTLECYYRDRTGQHFPIGHEYVPPMNLASSST